MTGRPLGTLRSVLLLITVGLAAVGAWLAWPRAAPPTDAEGSPRAAPTPALAQQTLDRFEQFRVGPAGGTLALGDAEITSVLRFALPGGLPPGVSDPEVRLAGSRVTLSARVAIRAFAELPALNPVIGLLPDTVPVRLEGVLRQFAEQSLVFRVDQLEAVDIPLPERLIPEVLSALGHTERGGLPGNTLRVPLPAGIGSVYVECDSLVLLGRR